jgi:hypothetical protein
MATITLDAVRFYFTPVAEYPNPCWAGYYLLGLDAGSPVGTFDPGSPPVDEGGGSWRFGYSSVSATQFYFELASVEVDTSAPPSVDISWSDPLDYMGADIELKFFYGGAWTTFHTESVSDYYYNSIPLSNLPDPGPSYCWANKVRTIEVM